MRIGILGCGAMGRAAAYAVMTAGGGNELVLIDHDRGRLEDLHVWLGLHRNSARLELCSLDIANRPAAVEVLRTVDACAVALPWAATCLAIHAALEAHCPMASITRPDYNMLPALAEQIRAARGCVLLPCGLEPGLTEILARHTAEKLDKVMSLQVRCGGIPTLPEPPLHYKILFGTHLPVQMRDAYAVVNGKMFTTPRFSGLEKLVVDGVGELEAHHDGMVPWLLDDPIIAQIPNVSQKTIRWPGFTARIQILHDLGLLSEEPVEFHGVHVVPRDFVETLCAPWVKWKPGDSDMIILRVDAEGEDQQGNTLLVRTECIDHYDTTTNLTAMARMTGFTLASATLMLAQGTIVSSGLLLPHQVITGAALERLLADLQHRGVNMRGRVPG